MTTINKRQLMSLLDTLLPLDFCCVISTEESRPTDEYQQAATTEPMPEVGVRPWKVDGVAAPQHILNRMEMTAAGLGKWFRREQAEEWMLEAGYKTGTARSALRWLNDLGYLLKYRGEECYAFTGEPPTEGIQHWGPESEHLSWAPVRRFGACQPSPENRVGYVG